MEALKLVIVTDEDGNCDAIPWDGEGELIIIEGPRPELQRVPWDGERRTPRRDTTDRRKRVH